jgi:hypothetical protein
VAHSRSGGNWKNFAFASLEARSPGRKVAAASVDCRDFAPTAQEFCEALRESLDEALQVSIASPATPATLFEAIKNQKSRVLLQIDSFELLSPLDHWLRERFLPQLPTNALVMTASRDPLPLVWQSDTGWREMVKNHRSEGAFAR